MAEATYNEGERVVTVTDPTITLTLSIAEAEMVYSMVGSVSLQGSDVSEESKAVWKALAIHLVGVAKHKPTELKPGYKYNSVVWKRK